MGSRPRRQKAPAARADNPVLAARILALELLNAVLNRKQPLEQAFHAHPRLLMLERRDRAFARNLTATTLRRLGQVDALVDHCLNKPKLTDQHPARNVLRIGIAQLVFLGTPPHAAVDTSVALARKTRHASMAGLVNAVLRRLASEASTLVEMQDAARLNTPAWLWASWGDAYGSKVCRRIAEQHLCDPPLDITSKDPDNRSLAAALGAERLPNGTLRIHDPAPVTTLAEFDKGTWWVQDAAATLPVRLFGNVTGKHIVDLCAAPGGKTAQMIAAGARVTAVDRSVARIRQMEVNLARLGLAADCIVANGTEWRPHEPADAVLIDAPCSATGTIRRHPDIAWLKSPQDVNAMTEIQARLLAAAAAMVRPGGQIVYASCSLQPEEGPELVKRVVAAEPSLRFAPIRQGDFLDLPEAVTDEGWLRSLPYHLADVGGMDGFFAARLIHEPL